MPFNPPAAPVRFPLLLDYLLMFQESNSIVFRLACPAEPRGSTRCGGLQRHRQERVSQLRRLRFTGKVSAGPLERLLGCRVVGFLGEGAPARGGAFGGWSSPCFACLIPGFSKWEALGQQGRGRAWIFCILISLQQVGCSKQGLHCAVFSAWGLPLRGRLPAMIWNGRGGGWLQIPLPAMGFQAPGPVVCLDTSLWSVTTNSGFAAEAATDTLIRA